jgi:hypothetical protein
MIEIISTGEIADLQNDDGSVEHTMTATTEPTGEKIEFHVQMKAWTLADMETLIIEAAARNIVGRYSDNDLSTRIQDRCIQLLTQKADAKLEHITSEIIDQPVLTMVPGNKAEPVTIGQLIGLYGREYLSQRVDVQGNATTSGYSTKPRIQYLVERYLDIKLKREIEAATNAAISEVQKAVKASHEAVIAAEKKRLREALAKVAA